ncbi:MULTISPECIES: N-acetylglucosaminidase [unclassified Virgibacillus]|uniref:N-acetylglucosaminidase n=1 Tax=unclassified Virgibacillus TaxID=2620237 RepID=UPI000A6DB969|nr:MULTISPECIES: N-acetylglucosaminidase [unclassified Virgibacillus]MBS7427882.1 N-acetylglucosaminidase [Virgibacillus sp. 19R1-5]
MRKSAILVVFMLIVQLFSTLTVLADSNKKGGDYNQLSEEEVFPNEADEAINKDESPKPKIENKSNLDTEGHSNYGTENNLEVEDKEAENESVPNSSIKDKATEKNTEQGVQENQDNGNEIKKEEVLESRTLTSQTINESNTSLLGHIKKGTKIYKTIGDTATSFSSDKYLNKVYYIKKQAKMGDQLYYLVSTEPSSTRGIIGWLKAKDLRTHIHKGIDKKNKLLYVKGTGSAYSKAWGGPKDLVYADLAGQKGKIFKVNKTEKVGNNTWYRGNLNGKEVFIHSSYLAGVEESNTGLLGHIKKGTKIYKTIGDTATSFSSDKYLNKVYYIKKQAKMGDQLYYLISTEPSSTRGIIGWLKAKDLRTHIHKGIDKKNKFLYVKGTGSAYSKAWGGPKDLVYADLAGQKGKIFKVNKTEKVGNNTWYRGNLNGKEVFIHSSYLAGVEESNTSLLGHIKKGTKIYKTIGDTATSFSSDKYLNKVYYIKKQAKMGEQLYYLISTEPSSTRGIIGWLKAKDLRTHIHKGIDKKNKFLYVKGTGSAYSKAWGGPKDLVYADLAGQKGKIFKVNKTEKVGNNTWYRGDLNGKEVFIHSSYLAGVEESNTSLLGHIKKGTKIYKTIGDTATSFSSDKYLNKVYYIKKQAKMGDQLYYLISTEPSSTRGIIGWLKAKDLRTHIHKGIDKKNKLLYLKGTGSAYSKAWGGPKDLVYADLAGQKGKIFKVNKTEKVGNNTWYRGDLNGKEVFIHQAYLNESKKTVYNLSLLEALKIQMSSGPKTDKRYDTYVSKQYIDKANRVSANLLNVRGGPSTSFWVVGQLKKGDKVTILGEKNGWYKIDYTVMWVNPSAQDVLYYLDPSNFLNDEKQKFQFVDLTKTTGSSAAQLYRVINNHLKGKGILENQAQAFIDAGAKHGINELYLVAHTILETGNGKSTLAKGVQYKGVKVYNMYGIGAIDSCPITCGAKRAYEEGWTTPYKAIVGGAKFAADKYIFAGQNTLYTIRWNPLAMDSLGKAYHQYASDIGWASKQVNTMYNLYQQLDSYTLKYDIPVYR